MRFDDLVRVIETRHTAGTRVVAIDGPSGSGKSTLARHLADRLADCAVVGIDDFNSWTDPTGATWWDRFERQVLVPAFAGKPVRYQVRDWARDEFGDSLDGWHSEPSHAVVIVEGVTAGRASVRRSGAYTIWVEASDGRRLTRGLARDGESHRQLWRAWMDAERDFFAADGTRESADLRVDGDPSVPHDNATQLVVL